MPTFSYTGFAPGAFSFPTGGRLSVGNQVQLDPGWDAQTDGYTFALTGGAQDDTLAGGDGVDLIDGGARAMTSLLQVWARTRCWAAQAVIR